MTASPIEAPNRLSQDPSIDSMQMYAPHRNYANLRTVLVLLSISMLCFSGCKEMEEVFVTTGEQGTGRQNTRDGLPLVPPPDP